MKKLVFMLLVGVFALGITATANAIPLAIEIPGPPVFVAPTGVASPGAALVAIASLSIPYTCVDGGGGVWATGILNQWVKVLPSGNMLFEYQVINSAASVAGITLMDTTIYTPFTTDVNTDFSGVSPWSFRRPFPGADIQFNYGGIGGLGAVATSDIMWIETNAQSFGLIGTTQLQGVGNTQLVTYAPRVPEPASVALLGLGLLGFVGKLRKKFMA